MAKCIVCLTDKDLNTHMKVEVDGEIFEVYLCDEHAESTTMGQVTKKVREIKSKLENAVQLAIDLGITIPEINISGNKDDIMPDMDILPTQQAPTAVESAQPVQQAVPQPVVQPVEQATEVPPRQIKLSETEAIESDTLVEMQTIEAKGGQIAIPQKTKGVAGETDIQIINVTDSVIQDRAKMMKAKGDVGQLNPGYVSECLACHGKGVHPILKKACPKCNGSGMSNSV
jgi:hypothetical protein